MANQGRRWLGYGPYKPVMVGKLLDIFRVFYNFVEVEKNKQTPAMRLGLAKGKIMIEDIIYYETPRSKLRGISTKDLSNNNAASSGVFTLRENKCSLNYS